MRRSSLAGPQVRILKRALRQLVEASLGSILLKDLTRVKAPGGAREEWDLRPMPRVSSLWFSSWLCMSGCSPCI